MRRKTPAGMPTRTRILVAIEDEALARLAMLTLSHGPYDTRRTSGLEATRATTAEFAPALIILDIDDADGRAVELIGDIESDGRTPMVALTRRGDLRRQLETLERGADDCIGIPFVPGELIARVHAVLRRAYGKAPTMFRPVRIGALEIDLVGRDVRTNGAEVHLTSLEQALLYLLASNAGTVVTRDRILDAIWGDDFLGESNIIERHVRSLRAKLQDDWRTPKYIETVAGTGYRFIAEPAT